MEAAQLNSARRVWVTNYAGHDYEKAKPFGELCYLTKGYISFQSLDRVKFTLAQALIDSSPDDYLLLSGTSIVCVIAAVLFYAMHRRLNLLNFDKTKDAYREVILTELSNNDLFRVLGIPTNDS